MENFKLKFGRLKRLKEGGFTLLEMLIALAVFGTVSTMSVGTLLSISEAQQKILTLRVTQDNISYVIDTMGKEIRTGTSYHCGIGFNDFSIVPRDCPDGGSSFTFSSGGNMVTYQLNSGRMERVFLGGTLGEARSVLTPAEVTITNLEFYVRGSETLSNGDHYQPRTLIVIQGTAGAKERTRSSITIQTMISQRALDS